MLFNVPSGTSLPPFTCNSSPAGLCRVLELLMAAGRLMKIPAVLLDEFD
jgi:hypothetical protein